MHVMSLTSPKAQMSMVVRYVANILCARSPRQLRWVYDDEVNIRGDAQEEVQNGVSDQDAQQPWARPPSRDFASERLIPLEKRQAEEEHLEAEKRDPRSVAEGPEGYWDT